MSDKQNAVAAFAPPRLPWHDALEQRFGDIGINKSTWKALTEAIYPAAQSVDSVLMALSYCKARKLDPFKRPVHIVPVYDSARGGYVDTVWPGISELRTTAFRTGLYAGCDDAAYGPDVTRVFSGEVGKKREHVNVTVIFPAWCQMTVHRLVGGQRVPVAGPKVYWTETYATRGRTEVPNEMWSKRPRGQLEKCAEAAALRKAFPEELGNEYAAEEMEGRRIGPEAARDVTPASEATARPQRADYQGEHPGLKPEPVVDDAEVVEGPGRSPLVDAVGEVVGEYEPEAFLEEFFAAVGDAKADRKLRAQMLRNNYETATTLYVQSGKGGMRDFLLAMQDLGFTGDDYREPKPETKDSAGVDGSPAPADGEAGAVGAPPAARAERVGYPFHSEAGKVLSTSDTPARFVAAIEDTIRGTLDEGADPKPFWTANKSTIDACYAANDPDISRRLDILQKEVFGAVKGKQGRMV